MEPVLMKKEKNTTMIFCTLFNKNYLDKGLALYYSINKHIINYKLYIFAFDKMTCDILKKINLDNVVVVFINDICDDELWNVKNERTEGEFCWTCTPIIIKHVLEKFNEKWCTYLDADCYFFASPAKELKKLINSGNSVGIVEHRFKKDGDYARYVKRNGKYCIQFNTFLNNKQGIEVLNEWRENCLKWCYARYENGLFGDQLYLNSWCNDYNCIYEIKNHGIGMAPWNINNYTLKSKGKFILFEDYITKESFKLIYYHFQAIKYLNKYIVYLNIWKGKKNDHYSKIKIIYGEYFKIIKKIRHYLKKMYGIEFLIFEKEKSESIYGTIKRYIFQGKSIQSVIENIKNLWLV